jgi:hypothetical protein
VGFLEDLLLELGFRHVENPWTLVAHNGPQLGEGFFLFYGVVLAFGVRT